MTHFNISVSPQCVHLPICLSTVYFLSLPPCLCVVYGVWEMRHFAYDTSQMNLKFRFLFLFFFFKWLLSTRGWQQSLCLLANSDSVSSGMLPQSLEEVGAVLSFPKLHGYCNVEAPVVSIEEHYCAFMLLREEWKNIKQRTWVQKLYLCHLDVQELLCTPVKNFVG